ncbi:unnamed protein product, partial [Bubo scandiacus]
MPESPVKRLPKEDPPWKEWADASVCHADVPREDTSIATKERHGFIMGYWSFGCLLVVFAKSRAGQMLPFTTLGICVTSQVPPPNTSQST